MRTTFLLLLLAVTTGAALLFGLAGWAPDKPSLEAAFLSEVKKLTASDAEAPLSIRRLWRELEKLAH